jgi:hypothetical protein
MEEKIFKTYFIEAYYTEFEAKNIALMKFDKEFPNYKIDIHSMKVFNDGAITDDGVLISLNAINKRAIRIEGDFIEPEPPRVIIKTPYVYPDIPKVHSDKDVQGLLDEINKGNNE